MPPLFLIPALVVLFVRCSLTVLPTGWCGEKTWVIGFGSTTGRLGPGMGVENEVAAIPCIAVNCGKMCGRLLVPCSDREPLHTQVPGFCYRTLGGNADGDGSSIQRTLSTRKPPQEFD
jgi:hypothetical protein